MSMSLGKFFQKVARRSRIFKFINFVGSAKIGGTRFKIPVIREMGLGNFSATEPWMMELIQDNVGYYYEDAYGLFNYDKKRTELTHSEAKFLIVFERVSQLPVAFVHFRFEKEDTRHVVYW